MCIASSAAITGSSDGGRAGVDIGCIRYPRLPRRLPPTALILVLGAVSVASARASVRLQLGRSYDGRPILAIRAGNPEGTRALVVGYHHHWLDGTATNWQNHHLSGSAAFTVELPAGSLTSAQVRGQVRAVVTLAAALHGRPGTSSRGSG